MEVAATEVQAGTPQVAVLQRSGWGAQILSILSPGETGI